MIWGTIAGMAFGVGELIYEKTNVGKISTVTWFSNILILLLGCGSLVSEEGVWFKLQPAIFMFFMSMTLLISSALKKPLLVAMAQKQNPNLPAPALALLRPLNFRLSILFLLLTFLLIWAALSWSTEAWAFLKGIGLFVLLIAYLACEVLYRRFFGK